MTRVSLSVIVCLALSATLPAQQAPVFSSRVTNVRVDVLVTDAGATVRGLTPADFEVRDNGVPQQVELMAVEEVPLNIALALDMSGSVSGERLTHLRAAAKSVVDALKPDDKVALLTFTGSVYVRTVLTADRDRVRRGLDEASSGGDTALVDAG
jgi:VWFA-related protein